MKKDQVPELGFGMMRLPLLNAEDESSVDVEQVKKMVDMYLDAGGTYFDTAYMYHDFHSEDVAREALTSRHPRESYRLATKMPVGFFKDKEGMTNIFDGQLKKCGVEYFDRYLVHNVNANNYDEAVQIGVFDYLREKKKEGKIRSLGFSFHDNAAYLDKVLTEQPDMEFVQLQVNYLDWTNPAVQSRDCCEQVSKRNIPILVMEPQRGGLLAHPGEEVEKILQEADPNLTPAQWAFRFVANVPGVVTVLSGMSDIEQMKLNIATFEDMNPLTDEQKQVLDKVVKVIRSKYKIPCTACDYCAGCPQSIPISRYFALYNASPTPPTGFCQEQMYYDNSISEGYGRAADCIACGQCESHCPQHIEIIENMKVVSERFDGDKAAN